LLKQFRHSVNDFGAEIISISPYSAQEEEEEEEEQQQQQQLHQKNLQKQQKSVITLIFLVGELPTRQSGGGTASNNNSHTSRNMSDTLRHFMAFLAYVCSMGKDFGEEGVKGAGASVGVVSFMVTGVGGGCLLAMGEVSFILSKRITIFLTHS